MSQLPLSVMTLHAFLLPESPTTKVPNLPTPSKCSVWVPATDMDWQDNGLPKRRSTHRYWLAVWNDTGDADLFMANAAQFFAAMADAKDAWHVKLLPYMHRGALHWDELSSPPNVFDGFHAKPASDCPVLVMTTVKRRSEVDKATLFGNTVTDVRSLLQNADGLLVEMLMLTFDFERFDGGTLTLWKNEASAVKWAYQGQAHKHAMDLDKERDLMERSSFARFAIEKSIGTWNGAEPLTGLNCG